MLFQINNKEEAAVRCRVHHVPADPKDSLPDQGRFWERQAEPLFPEQASVLEELNRMDKRIRSIEEEEEEEYWDCKDLFSSLYLMQLFVKLSADSRHHWHGYQGKGS